MIAQAVVLQIAEDLTVVPVDDRQDFKHTTLHRQHRQMRTAAGLLATQTGEPGLHAERLNRTIHRFDFVDVIVLLDAFDALLPQFAVARFLPRRRMLRAEHLQIQVKLFG
ncbi:hypothetical protein D3C80_1914690 [compost metagenome]